MIKEQFVHKKSGHNHAKYQIRYHLIFVTKYRRKLISSEISDLIKRSVTRAVSMSKNFEIEAMEIDPGYSDHIHFLVKATPAIAPFEIVRLLKQVTTYDIWHTSEEVTSYMSRYYWKSHHLWTGGYFCSSIGDACTETVRRYIENQG